MWFTEPDANRIGRITPAGVITEFSRGLRRYSFPCCITGGPDGNMWFAEARGEEGITIGRITPAGVITEFGRMTPGSFPNDMALGPDGNLWVAEDLTKGGIEQPPQTPTAMIGRITPAGVITEFSEGISPDTFPNGITAGPDGNSWFAEGPFDSFSRAPTPLIGRVTPAGVISEFPARSRDGGANDITLGPDGNLWFTEWQASRIGRSTPAGTITEFRKGITPDSNPQIIAAGPDGNLWFTEVNNERVARITPRGRVTEFSAGLSRDNISHEPGLWHYPFPNFPYGIAAGPDGNVWFTEQGGNRIGRITPAGVISEYPATAQIRFVHQLGPRSVAVRLQCPVGAALPCKGTVQLGKTGNGGSRRLRPLAPGRRTTVVVPITLAWQRLIVRRGRLDALVLLRPQPNSMAGAIAQPITLWATSRPRIPAVTG